MQFNHHRQGAVGNEWEGMRRIDRDRRQDRQQAIDEQLLQPCPIVARQRRIIEDRDAFGE